MKFGKNPVNLKEDHLRNIPAKFGKNPVNSSEEDFFEGKVYGCTHGRTDDAQWTQHHDNSSLASGVNNNAEPHSSVGKVVDLRTGGGCLIPSSANILLRTDDSHCNRIHSSLIPVRCLHGKAGSGLERML